MPESLFPPCDSQYQGFFFGGYRRIAHTSKQLFIQCFSTSPLCFGLAPPMRRQVKRFVSINAYRDMKDPSAFHRLLWKRISELEDRKGSKLPRVLPPAKCAMPAKSFWTEAAMNPSLRKENGGTGRGRIRAIGPQNGGMHQFLLAQNPLLVSLFSENSAPTSISKENIGKEKN